MHPEEKGAIPLDNPIYTIGHSDHTIETFLSLLQKWNVNAVADVRSSPYSKRHPQFSKAPLEALLRKGGITYVFLGKELGARPSDSELYTEGKADFRLIAESQLFRKGIHRLLEGRKRWSIAVMCAEKDPLDCHRTILVSRALAEGGARVFHILADGTAESHQQALKRLFALHGKNERDLFLTPEEMLSAVYRLQEEKIASRINTSTDQEGAE